MWFADMFDDIVQGTVDTASDAMSGVVDSIAGKPSGDTSTKK